ADVPFNNGAIEWGADGQVAGKFVLCCHLCPCCIQVFLRCFHKRAVRHHCRVSHFKLVGGNRAFCLTRLENAHVGPLARLLLRLLLQQRSFCRRHLCL